MNTYSYICFDMNRKGTIMDNNSTETFKCEITVIHEDNMRMRPGFPSRHDPVSYIPPAWSFKADKTREVQKGRQGSILLTGR